MNLRRWQVQIAVVLIVAAVVVYALRWILFSSENLHQEMLRYLVDDVAFLFIQVLLVSILVDGLMQRRQRETMLDKLNMIVGAFFTRVRRRRTGPHRQLDGDLERCARTSCAPVLEGRDYERATQAFRAHKPVIELSTGDLVSLRERLTARRRTCSACSATRRCWSTRRSPTCSGRSRTSPRNCTRAGTSTTCRATTGRTWRST